MSLSRARQEDRGRHGSAWQTARNPSPFPVTTSHAADRRGRSAVRELFTAPREKTGTLRVYAAGAGHQETPARRQQRGHGRELRKVPEHERLQAPAVRPGQPERARPRHDLRKRKLRHPDGEDGGLSQQESAHERHHAAVGAPLAERAHQRGGQHEAEDVAPRGGADRRPAPRGPGPSGGDRPR